MIRRSALAIASAMVLLGSTVATTVASSGPRVSRQSAISTPRAGAAAVAHRYFTLLNTAMRTGNIAPLAALFAPDATLTEYASLTFARPLPSTQTVHGLPAIRATLRELSRITPRLHWTLDMMMRVSNTVVNCYAHTASTPARRISLVSWQRLMIRHGAIVSLEMSTYYEPQ